MCAQAFLNMGVFKSKFLDQEKTSWIKSHELEYEPHFAKECRKLVSNFKDGCDLHLSYENKTILDIHMNIGLLQMEFG